MLQRTKCQCQLQCQCQLNVNVNSNVIFDGNPSNCQRLPSCDSEVLGRRDRQHTNVCFFFSQRAPWLCYLHFSNTTMVLRCAIQCFIVQHTYDLYFCKVNLCREFFWIFLQVLAKVEKVKAFIKKVRALLNLIFQRMIFSNFNKIF